MDEILSLFCVKYIEIFSKIINYFAENVGKIFCNVKNFHIFLSKEYFLSLDE